MVLRLERWRCGVRGTVHCVRFLRVVSGIDRHAAVSVIDVSHLRDSEAAARFQPEARLIVRLEHVHIQILFRLPHLTNAQDRPPG